MHSSRIPIVTLAAIAALLGGACGSEGDEQTGSSSSSPTTTTARADKLDLQLVDCHQAGFPTDIDPESAQARLLDDQVLFLSDEGRARFTLIAKHCQDIVVDGVPAGPGHFNTAWIRIEGPEETRTVEGESPVVANPTDYYVPVAFQTDNADYADATTTFGVPMSLADSITMSTAAPGLMTGAVQDPGDPPLSYEWSMDNTNALPPATNAVVHVLEGLDDQGQPLTYDIECLVEGGWFGNPTTITFEEGSALTDLVGTGYSGVGPSPNLSCDVTISRQAG